MASTKFCLFPTALGDCGIAWRGSVVIATQLPEQDASATATLITARTHASQCDPTGEIAAAIKQITALLNGVNVDLRDIACDFSAVDSFARKVYAAAREIPPGDTQTYGDIAAALGNKRFAQNVGRALGNNPFPIIVPCHRVIGANDTLTGFSAHGGVNTKRRMLSIEGAVVAAPDLFDGL